MPENLDLLLGIAEVSVGLITFTALLLVLRQLVGGQLTEFHVMFIKGNAALGILTALFSLLPLALLRLNVETQWVWSISSGLLASALILLLAWYSKARKKAAPNRRQNIGSIFASVTGVISPLVLIPHAFGVIYAGSSGPYAICLLLVLLTLAISFFQTLGDFLLPFAKPTEDEQ